MASTTENVIFNGKSLPFIRPANGVDGHSCSMKPLILESHARCQYLGLKTFESCDYSALLASDSRIAHERNARLISHTTAVLATLDKFVADFGSMIVLTDETGTILQTHCDGTFAEKADRAALRPGVSWSESSKGTNAIGTALILESSIYMQGEDHFFQSNHFLSCAAAPILDHSGNVIGVLDASGDKRVFHPHSLTLVEMCARTIENNWFLDKFRQNLQLHFHPVAELIGTMEEGIIALGEDGQILGANRAGRKILDVSASTLRIKGVQRLFGLGLGELFEKLHHSAQLPITLALVTGHNIFVRLSGSEPTIFSNPMKVMIKPIQRECSSPASLVLHSNDSRIAEKAICQLDELDAGDAQVRSVTQRLKHVIDKDIAILIVGETGTGKELLANAIHQFSKRRSQAFIAINCASIPEQLIESELFGYEEGAFTGAKRKGGIGKLLQANGGTLFLDEIGDMPLPLQARLLRVLQERKVVPLGGNRSTDFDVNLICATHRNLREMIVQKIFRDDLYYRINGISVKLPPLRERTDLVAICQKILRELSPHRSLSVQTSLLEAFLRYPWPGNLRQLNNVLKTAAVLVDSDIEITREHLPDDFCEEMAELSQRAMLRDAVASIQGAPMSPVAINNLDQVEITAIMRVLNDCAGNVSLASKQLNVSRNTIYRRIKKIG